MTSTKGTITNMADPVESRSRDHYKQSVVVQRTEGSDIHDPQMLRRRSLTIAHLYLTSASLARTRTRSLTRTVSVQTSPVSGSLQDDDSDWESERAASPLQFSRPKSEFLPHRYKEESPVDSDSVRHDLNQTPSTPPQRERPKSEHPLRRSRRGLSVGRPVREFSARDETVPSVTFERPKSEHHTRRPLYRDVIIRESDQKRVIPRRPKTGRTNSDSSEKTSTSKRKL